MDIVDLVFRDVVAGLLMPIEVQPHPTPTPHAHTHPSHTQSTLWNVFFSLIPMVHLFFTPSKSRVQKKKLAYLPQRLDVAAAAGGWLWVVRPVGGKRTKLVPQGKGKLGNTILPFSAVEGSCDHMPWRVGDHRAKNA